MTKKTLILWFFILVKFGLHCIIVAPEYDLHRDEYLHLDQGKHLAWGYLSVPPFTSWTSYIILLLGNSEFWVKFFPALFGVLTIVVVWKAIEALGGNLFALVLGATAVTFSVLLRMNMLYQPNSVDILAWTLLYFAMLRYIQTEQNKWLYIAAAVFSFGFLNKYNVVFLTAGLGPALLLTEQRKIFTNKNLYLAATIAVVIILPNLIWQYNHNFPVLHHMKLLAKTQLVNVNRLDFLKEQILFFLGSMFVIVAAFVSFFKYPAFRKYQVFFWSFVFTLSLFTYLKAKGYYAIGLYPIFIAFGAVYLEHLFTKKLIWLRYASILIIVALFIPIFRVAFPTKSPSVIAQDSKRYQKLGLLRWEDGKDHELPQDFADMLGWRELASKVDAAYTSMPEREATLVLCDNYGQAGAINYYSKQGVQAVTFNADYIDWFDLSKKYKHVVRVKNGWEREEELRETGAFFETGFAADSITNRYARERGATIFIFHNAKIDINARIAKEIEEEQW